MDISTEIPMVTVQLITSKKKYVPNRIINSSIEKVELNTIIIINTNTTNVMNINPIINIFIPTILPIIISLLYNGFEISIFKDLFDLSSAIEMIPIERAKKEMTRDVSYVILANPTVIKVLLIPLLSNAGNRIVLPHALMMDSANKIPTVKATIGLLNNRASSLDATARTVYHVK